MWCPQWRAGTEARPYSDLMQIPKQGEIGFSWKFEICCAFPGTRCKWNFSVGFVCAFFRAFLFPNGRRLTPKGSRVSRVWDTLRDTLAHTLDIPLTKTRYSSPDPPVDCFAIPRSCGGKSNPTNRKSPLPDPVWLRAVRREIAYREFRNAG